MEDNKLKQEYNFINENKRELLKKYGNNYILVHNKKVIDSFKSFDEAATEGLTKFGADGSFLIHFLSEVEPINLVFCAVL